MLTGKAIIGQSGGPTAVINKSLVGFIKEATKRTGLKNPFHQFSTIDTVSLSAMYCGETVLAKAISKIGIEWDNDEAHSALYDTQKTSELFCKIFNSQKIDK